MIRWCPVCNAANSACGHQALAAPIVDFTGGGTMKPTDPPKVPDNRVLSHRGVAGYQGTVEIYDPTRRRTPAEIAAVISSPSQRPSGQVAGEISAELGKVAAAFAQAAADMAQPAAPPAPTADLEKLLRNDLVKLAVSLGIRGQGSNKDLIAAIEAKRAAMAAAAPTPVDPPTDPAPPVDDRSDDVDQAAAGNDPSGE